MPILDGLKRAFAAWMVRRHIEKVDLHRAAAEHHRDRALEWRAYQNHFAGEA